MSIEHLLAPDARLEKVAGGFTWVEGPCWIPARGVLRFSDIPGNQVLECSEATGAVAVVSAEAEFTNGRTLSRDGSVVECSHGRRAVQRDRGASTPGAPYAPEVPTWARGRRDRDAMEGLVVEGGARAVPWLHR